MSMDDEIARLQRLNAELNASLKRCRDLVNHWRFHVAANSNDEDLADEDNGREPERRS